MSKWFKLIPRGKDIQAKKRESEEDNKIASVEQAAAINMAIKSADTVAQVGLVNYKNGFSVALGNAFAAKKGTA